MHNRLFSLLSLFIICTLISCQDDDAERPLPCEDASALKLALAQKVDEGTYVKSIDTLAQAYQLNFLDQTLQALPFSCIERVEVDNGTNEIRVFFPANSNPWEFPLAKMIDNVTVTVDPFGYNPLSARVTVETTIEGTFRIRVVGKDGPSSDFEHTFEDNRTSHTLPILGLYPDHDNTVILYLLDKNSQQRATDTLTITTGPLPRAFAEIHIAHAERGSMEPGFTLISNRTFYNPNIPYMIDSYGNIRWLLYYKQHPVLKRLFYDVGVERLANGNFYFGDMSTSAIYEVDIWGEIIQSWDLQGYNFHHNVQEKPDGNFLVTASDPNALHLNGAFTVEDFILEIDRQSGNIVMTWDLRELLDEYRTTWFDDLGENPIDWAHLNAVIYDPSDTTIIVSCRHQGMMKFNYQHEVVWIMGPHKGWGKNRKGEDLSQFLLTPLDKNGQPITDPMVLQGDQNHPDFEWNWYQHAPEFLPNGHLILYDNGDNRNYFFNGPYSRAVEYIIDTKAMTIQQVWQYGKERGAECYSRLLSDVDYLPQTGNILFVPGAGADNGGGKLGGKVVEIAYPSQTVVFEARFSSNAFLQLHRAERMQIYP